jgi:PLP dependent protein
MPGLIHGLDSARIAANLERVREVAGEEIEILAATKYVPTEEMGALLEAGVKLVGENRQQDLARKHERWGDSFEWDFIGNLQSRKVRSLVPDCRLIHSVATDSALEQLGRYGEPATEVLVEVNIAGEEGKGGVAPAELSRFLKRCPVRAGPRGFTTSLRPPRRAGGHARTGAPLDGHVARLARRGRGGSDDHPSRHGLICVNRRYPGHNP